jgi:hypothetical protein
MDKRYMNSFVSIFADQTASARLLPPSEIARRTEQQIPMSKSRRRLVAVIHTSSSSSMKNKG